MQVARVMWLANGGPAQRSGIKVGDKVSTHSSPSHLPLTPYPFGVIERDLRREKTLKRSARRSTSLSTLTLRLREGEREIALFPGRESRLFPLKGRTTRARASSESVLWTTSGFVTNTESGYGREMRQKRSFVRCYSIFTLLAHF